MEMSGQFHAASKESGVVLAALKAGRTGLDMVAKRKTLVLAWN
jgi:hypothetical protein